MSNSSAYLETYFKHNVDLADPATKQKWRELTSHLDKKREYFHTEYPTNIFLDGIYGILKDEKTPGKLTKMGREISGLVNTLEKPDTAISELFKLYLETAKQSGSKHAMDIGIEAGETLLELQN